MNLTYVFPEPLPLPRARGIQVIHTIASLAQQGVAVDLFHAPGEADPFGYYEIPKPDGVTATSISRNLPWPLERVSSNRIFFFHLRSKLNALSSGMLLMVRHIKIAAMIAKTYPQLKMIYEAHEVFADTARPKQKMRIGNNERCVVTSAAAIVTNSNATACRLRECYPEISCPIVTIPNGVDLPYLRSDRDWSKPQEKIIYAGSFFGWKGVADLVSAAADLPGYSIRLIGGSAEQAAELLASTPIPGAHLIFEGRLPHREVMETLMQSCIAVLPNRQDTDSRFTSPIKLFEYMGAGCALVASDLPSIREILNNDDAEWFKPGDLQSLAAAIKKLASDPVRAEEMGHRLRQKANEFTWAARGQKLAKLIANI